MEFTKLQLGEHLEFDPERVRRKILLDTPSLRLILVCLEEGQNLTEHRAPVAAAIHVQSGKAVFSAGGVAHEVGRGALFWLPPHTPHAVRALTRTALLIFLTPSPAAE